MSLITTGVYRRAALGAAPDYREGMSRDERAERSGAREPDEGPSARWAALLAVVALLPAPGVLLGVLRSLPEQGDRKSTRLNSSHVAISYAVFCLKQKNRQ